MRVLRERENHAVASIEAAFPLDAPPTASEMQNDHCPECAEVSALFAGRRWDDIRVVDLVGNPSVSFLTGAGFRYYLPALMLRCIEAPVEVDCVPLSVLGRLSPPGGKPNAKLAELRASFDPARIGAVHAFLLVLEAREKIDWYPPEAFDSVPPSKGLARALAYWSD
ncbi:MAG TPA: DUF6714 family protein [Labilithrix sp.]|nr:DUF6714 family protein [Labilithrix sp.]